MKTKSVSTKNEAAAASWVLRNKTTKEVICETFDERKVAALNTAKYEAVPILEYLIELNRNIRAASTSPAGGRRG